MDYDEYKKRREKIENDRDAGIAKLAEEYALSNSPHAVGDIAEDHIGKIQIKEINVSFKRFSIEPECIYWGTELKKDGQPRKNGAMRNVYQQNLIKF